LLTDAEIDELEFHLKEMGIETAINSLNGVFEETNPNYRVLYNAIVEQEYNDKNELIKGKRGFLLEGSSRSGKTWAGIDIIIFICLFLEEKCTINIYRETYNEFKTTLYDDFKRRLDDFGLKNPFHDTKEIKSFKIKNNTIFFLGDGKQGGGCDYAFFNEMMNIRKSVFDQVEMRCRKFWWGDYNPSFTEHWVFDSVDPRPDVGFERTTFLVNEFISVGERNKILSYEPWKPGSYIVKDNEVMCYNKLTKKIEVVTKSNFPAEHPTNIRNGTSDEFMWKVYGLGLRGAMKGVIFNHIEWIEKEEFPDIAYIYTNDFGFTTDPNALTRYAEDENNIWVEPLCYEPIETSDELLEVLKAHGVKMNSEQYGEDGDMVICDSSDKYTGENKGTVEMVSSLKKKSVNAIKVSKTKSVMFWLLSMKTKKIHVVKNHLYAQMKKEKENYRLKEINGISINQPIDAWNHFWDSIRYGHMAYNNPSKTYQMTEEQSRKLNY
jgi:phage terminase large subunit